MLALLVIGDWSCDGHGRTETIRVDHNLETNSALKSAYKAGVAILGHDFEKVVAEDYQDGSMPDAVLEALVEHGILEADDGDFGSDRYWQIKGPCPIVADSAYVYNDKVQINYELHAAIWMAIAQLGNPSLVYTTPKRAYEDKINIGGYGFFE